MTPEQEAMLAIPTQCKDIPDVPILGFLAKNPDKWHNWYPNGNPLSVWHAMPRSTHWKLVLGKMRMLMRRGFVEGCSCGCRGDFHLTEKGACYLNLCLMLKAERWPPLMGPTGRPDYDYAALHQRTRCSSTKPDTVDEKESNDQGT